MQSSDLNNTPDSRPCLAADAADVSRPSTPQSESALYATVVSLIAVVCLVWRTWVLSRVNQALPALADMGSTTDNVAPEQGHPGPAARRRHQPQGGSFNRHRGSTQLRIFRIDKSLVYSCRSGGTFLNGGGTNVVLVHHSSTPGTFFFIFNFIYFVWLGICYRDILLPFLSPQVISPFLQNCQKNPGQTARQVAKDFYIKCSVMKPRRKLANITQLNSGNSDRSSVSITCHGKAEEDASSCPVRSATFSPHPPPPDTHSVRMLSPLINFMP